MIIAISGRAGSGKSSVAQHIVTQHQAKRISFATPLKWMACDIWEFTEEQVFGDAEAKETIDSRWGITPREAMQKLGQAARDHIGDDVWIDALLDLIRVEPNRLWVIDDLRYRKEAKHIVSVGGHVLRLHCEDSISIDAGDHPSEAEVDLIPDEHIFVELRSSRRQGLEHLFGLVDDAIARMFR